MQLLASSTTWGKHHLIGSFEVFLVTDITHVAIGTVGLNDDGLLQVCNQIIERVAHLLYLTRLVVPFLCLLWVCLHLHGKLIV